MLFVDIPTSHYISNVFILVHVNFFFSGRCTLELKFAIYHRAASWSSQPSYAVLAEKSLPRPDSLQTLPVALQCSHKLYDCILHIYS